MSTAARGTFTIASWEEAPYDEVAGQAKLARATVGMTLHGDLDGEGTITYLMTYREDESASYVFLQRVIGRLGGRSGGFVLQGSGAYEVGVARGDWTVVPGSGTDELRGLRGEGGFHSAEERGGTYTLDYELA